MDGTKFLGLRPFFLVNFLLQRYNRNCDLLNADYMYLRKKEMGTHR